MVLIVSELTSNKNKIVVCPPTDATVTVVSSEYTVDEHESSVEVCASLTNVPGGGLECEIIATINSTDGPKAGKLPSLYVRHNCTRY